MEYGILMVEDGGECWQIIGSVHTLAEARELANDYNSNADPETPNDTTCPPENFFIMRRNQNGYYTRRESLAL